MRVAGIVGWIVVAIMSMFVYGLFMVNYVGEGDSIYSIANRLWWITIVTMTVLYIAIGRIIVIVQVIHFQRYMDKTIKKSMYKNILESNEDLTLMRSVRNKKKDLFR